MLEKKLVLDTINDNYIQFQEDSKWLENLSVEEHDRVFHRIKNKLLRKDLYKNIDLLSTLNLGDIGIKLIKKYPKDIIIEAMIEDSIYRAITDTPKVNQPGLSISTLIDGL